MRELTEKALGVSDVRLRMPGYWCVGAMWCASAVAQPIVDIEPITGSSVHQRALETHRFEPTSPDLIGDGGVPIPLQPRDDLRGGGPCRTIFGFLPYWETAENVQWDVITHLAAFSVEVNADGTLGNDHGWPWTSVINTAHANGVKVVLVATLFDPDDIQTLITTPAFKNAFFENIKNKMLEGTADGINIDFEGNGPFVNDINAFMAELTAFMHTEVPGSEVTFDGPAVNWAGWDFPGLAASCDGIFIMGYAFAGSFSSVSGANAPLTGGSINIMDTVLDEYGQVTSATPEKLILGVPYFGHHWTTSSSSPGSSIITFEGSTRFRNDQPDSEIFGRLWHATSQTPWFRWFDGSAWNQVWYDDAESLGLKYQLAQDNDLAGVGMWALNYDGTRPELWDELRDRFVDACCAETTLTSSVIAFEDDFDAGTSGLTWDLFTSSSDYTADFAFDYSADGIAPAPNSSGGSTVGAKFTVNNSSGNPTAVSAFPSGKQFAGDMALHYDMWINYNGGAGGGSGSTEHATAGVYHAADGVNWPSNPSADGFWFAVTGEGGATDDYQVRRDSTLLSDSASGFVASSGNASDSYYQSLFPTPPFETTGAPGKQWVQGEIRRQGDRIEWWLDGTLIASRTDTTHTSGNVMLGYMDLFSSIASPASENYVIFDNVRVELLPDTDCNANGTADACELSVPFDFDGDGTVGLADVAGFVDCHAGIGQVPAPSSPTCSPVCLMVFDQDSDQDIDLRDFADFQAQLQAN